MLSHHSMLLNLTQSLYHACIIFTLTLLKAQKLIYVPSDILAYVSGYLVLQNAYVSMLSNQHCFNKQCLKRECFMSYSWAVLKIWFKVCRSLEMQRFDEMFCVLMKPDVSAVNVVMLSKPRSRCAKDHKDFISL